MFYKLKKDTHIRISNGYGYITSTDLNKTREADETGSVFFKVISNVSQTIDQLTDKLIETFKNVNHEIILSDAQDFYDNLVKEGFLVKGEMESELSANDTSCKYVQPAYNDDCINFYLPGLD